MQFIAPLMTAILDALKVPFLLLLSFTAGKKAKEAEDNEEILKNIRATDAPVSEPNARKLRAKYRR